MGRYDNTKRNQYNSTPRKVFDTYIDRMAVKRARDKEDLRADMLLIFSKLELLTQRLHLIEEALNVLSEHVDRHCAELDTARDPRNVPRDS